MMMMMVAVAAAVAAVDPWLLLLQLWWIPTVAEPLQLRRLDKVAFGRISGFGWLLNHLHQSWKYPKYVIA